MNDKGYFLPEETSTNHTIIILSDFLDVRNRQPDFTHISIFNHNPVFVPGILFEIPVLKLVCGNLSYQSSATFRFQQVIDPQVVTWMGLLASDTNPGESFQWPEHDWPPLCGLLQFCYG